MSCKKQICYEHIFQYIHDNIFAMNCASFTTDFELAMRNAISKLYPSALHRCCWFHYAQAIKRNASQISGFIPMIRGCEAEREIYYKIMCLPLLPPALIQPTFDKLKARGLILSTNEAFHDFLNYVQRQWIEKVCVMIFSSYFAVLISCCLFFVFVIGRAEQNLCVRYAHTNDQRVRIV